jgi:hypothetical protein
MLAGTFFNCLSFVLLLFFLGLIVYCVRIPHLELSLVFTLEISPSTDIAANIRTLTLLNRSFHVELDHGTMTLTVGP